jgi:hypothetical protein
MENETFVRNLRCPLSEAGILERSKQLARLHGTIAELKAALASEVAGRKAAITAQEGDAGRLASEIRDEAVYQNVDCERRYDYERKQVSEVRLDTGEELSRRAMTFTELQMDLLQQDDETEPPDPPVRENPVLVAHGFTEKWNEKPEVEHPLEVANPVVETTAEPKKEEEPLPKAKAGGRKKKFIRKEKKAPKVRRG